MKRLMILLLALTVLIASASAEELLTLGEPLTGTIYWPEDADETTAVYSYSYTYPYVLGDSEIAELINGNYAYEIEYAHEFRVPMNGEDLQVEPGAQYYTTVISEVTCLNERYMSVRTLTETIMGPAASLIISSNTFSLQGNTSSGAETNLPHLLGLLNEGSTGDEWLEERQIAKADNCVRTLVWETIEGQMADGSVTFIDDLTEELFGDCFFPETDYYLDADGNPVFYIQAGDIAPLTEGILYFPFTMEELLDEI